MPDTNMSLDQPSPISSQNMEVAEKPFVIMLHQRDQMPNGYFRPDATMTLRRALRTSGLLLALPPDEVKSLLLMLTFLTPNGWCQPTVQQLADAMRVSEMKVRARMQRLRDFHWQDHPVVTELQRDSGMDSFALSPAVVGVQQDVPEPAPEAAPLSRLAGREAIIAYSRAKYARPRAEVERAIAERMGWKEQGDGPEALLRRKLLGVAGLLREHVDLLLERYPQERIERQLAWLPHRNAKSPARFLMAAIENDYDPPIGVRLQQTSQEGNQDQGEVSESVPPHQHAEEDGHDVAASVSPAEAQESKVAVDEQNL